MNINALKDNIRQDEGFKPYAYMDSLGYWTIGYGRLIDKKGGGITTKEAEYLLDNDIQKAILDMTTHFSWFSKLSDNRQQALVEMRFQLGITRLLGFVNMLIAIENYNFSEAAIEALNSKWAMQTPKRAARIAGMLKNG